MSKVPNPPLPPSDDDGSDTPDGAADSETDRFDHAAQAQAAIQRIAGGADPAAEAFALSNRFTDSMTGRVAHWLRILRGDRPDGDEVRREP